MKKSSYQTADARDSLSDSGCKRLYIIDSGCSCLYIRQRMQESLKLDPGVYRADLYTLSRA